MAGWPWAGIGVALPTLTPAIVAAVVLSACGGDGSSSSSHEADSGDFAQDDADTDECPLTPSAIQFLAQVSDSCERQIDTVATMNGPTDLSVLWLFVGTNAGVASQAHLVAACAESSRQAETCQSMLNPARMVIPNVDTCFRTGCEAKDVALVDVYATTPPHRVPEDRVAISYPTTQPFPPGEVVYDPNPWTRWTLDFSQPGVVRASASLETYVSALLATGERIDLSFTGASMGVYDPISKRLNTMTELLFSNVAAAGPVTITMTNSDGRSRSGVVLVGDRQWAKITQDGTEWQSNCGP